MMVLGLCLPLTGWAAESAAPGWQLTPFLGYSSSIDFEAMDEPAPTPHVGSLQGESSGELLYSHQSTPISPDQPDRLTVDTLHFAGALTLSDNLMAPYLGAGIGVTRFDAYDSETAPSMSLALGVQPRLGPCSMTTARFSATPRCAPSGCGGICSPSGRPISA